MVEEIILTASGVEVPDRTPGQYWMTVLLVIGFVAGLIIAYKRTGFSKLPRAQRQHKSALLGSIRNGTPETVRIPRGANVDDYREDLQAAFDRAFDRARGGESEHDPDRVTIREATVTVGLELYDAVDRLPTIPRAARRVGVLAVLVTVFGALAVSTETIVRLLTADRQTPGLTALLADAAALTQSVVSAVTNALATFPGGALLAELLFAYTLLAATLAYHHWYLFTVVLVAGAVAITALDRRVPDDLETRLYEHRRTLALETVGAVVTVWLVGVVPAGVGAVIGTVSAAGRSVSVEAIGAAIGALFAVGLTTVFVAVAVKSLSQRLRHAATIDWDGGPDALVASYLVARYCAVGVALMAAPFVPVYAAAAILEGRVFEVLAALVAADALTQLVVVTVLAAVVASVAYVARDARGDVRDALTETLARQSIRVAIFQRGLTVGAFIVAYGVVWAFTRSYVLAPVGATILAVAVYAAYEGVDRAAYRLELFGRDAEAQQSVLLQAYAAEDADGTLHPVAKIGTDYRTSRASIDETVTDALEIADGVACKETSIPKTLGRQRAEDLLELGLVDADIETELQESIRQAIKADLEPTGRTTMDSLERACAEFPEDRWRAEVRRYQLLNVLSVTGEHVRLERDVWSVESDDPSVRWLSPGV